jgi:hypothetical protein
VHLTTTLPYTHTLLKAPTFRNLFIQASVNHITKSEFFIVFKAAYNKVFTKENIKSGFKGAGISP